MDDPIARPRSRTATSQTPTTRLPQRATTMAAHAATTRHSFQSESNLNHQFDSSPIIRRTFTGQQVTLRPIAEVPDRPQWKAGAEPGLDPAKENGGRHSLPTGNITKCAITAVDFSKDHISHRTLDNESLHDFLKEPRGEKSTCRWINVNGLSWDVISALGIEYKLSHLALEDLVNTKNRTKADWYKNNLFIILSLQRLVALETPTSDDESEVSSDTVTANTLANKLRKAITGDKTPDTLPTVEDKSRNIASVEQCDQPVSPEPYKTLQRYNGGENQERVDYLESKSLLKEQDRQVIVEQVAVFVTSNNEIISFFESSAKEVEEPILKRLNSPSTMIRQSADATMVTQALIDAVIDLALPVNTAFKNAIDQMEVDVLTLKPDKKYANLLYILKSEMTAMKNLISPITKMILTLRNHRNLNLQPEKDDGPDHHRSPSTVVTISEMTNMYLGDVEDHCIMIEESLNQMLHSAGEISDLIFNTLNIDTNNVMKTLTLMTVGFFPLTFLTGYFGMNFHRFSGIDHGDGYFWIIAIPVMVAIITLIEYQEIESIFSRKKQRRSLNKQRVLRERRKMAIVGR